ncbi:hypothetical protein ACFX2I_021732 [Malus domestica]|uniref:Transmembrane protein n=1 Tax=Malus domestica TaxID=3750 RepID=A0A498HMH4_MALDO|nr:uncharacterized protein LOC103403688 [Malus domestica]XP_050129795.1 uncharacterized protein LOC126606442 [Malus sylvestris]RXH71930.1 hypothetical protein DVH24_025431 [Malus domestica]
MPKIMAVTHADLSPSRPTTGLGSKTGAVIMVLTILSGLFCFILCLIAEATRSKVTWLSSDEGENECEYSGSGKTPLLCAASAFLGLAVIMVVEHGYMLFAISNSPPSALAFWEPHYSGPAKSLKWQAAFFFVSTWVCFAVGEILLLIGLSVESGHLRKWSRPRPICLVLREGVLSAAGVFALTTVFLAAGLYLTASRAQRISQRQETLRREMIEASILYASPPRSPPLTTIPRENPLFRENHIEQPPLIVNPTAPSKQLNL